MINDDWEQRAVSRRGRRAGVFCVLAGSLLVAGCGIGSLISGKRPPDEFAVYSRAPLSVPPDYGKRPTTDIAPSATPLGPAADAREALLDAGGRPTISSTPAAQNVSPGTNALLARTGALSADPAIRQEVNQETTVLAENDQTFLDHLMFWRKNEPIGEVVDPTAEAQRIQRNQALGDPVTSGPTPTIQRKPRGLLEGILN